jgi:hypothetical protein
MSVALAVSWLLMTGPVSEEASHRWMLEQLNTYREWAGRNNPYVGTEKLQQARSKLRELGPDGPPEAHWGLQYALGVLELHQGNESASIEALRRAEGLLGAVEHQVPNDAITQLIFDLGVAYLRLGETQNCCQLPSAASCILPLQNEAVHSRREGSEQAAKYFQQVLARTAPHTDMHLSALWLFHIAHLTLGNDLMQVPEEFRMRRGVVAAGASFPRFENVARESGVDTFSLAGGAIAEDFDGDADIDLVVSSWDPSIGLKIFWNRGGRFDDGSEQAGLAGILGGLNLIQADYDNDGHTDILVLRGGWLMQQGRVPSSLLRNRGDGTFVDVTRAAGLARHAYPTQTASWGDYDLDGDLDLYIGNESLLENPVSCELYRNNGDGTFTDVAAKAGVLNGLMAKAVIWGDYDGDRWPDLYVSNFGGENRLYRNQRDGTFCDVAPLAGVSEPKHSFPAWFWDYNNDGALDLFVSSYAGGIAQLAAYAVDRPGSEAPSLAKLYQNQGDGRFVDRALDAGLHQPHQPMGSNFGDLDNDGFLDFYLGTGWPEYHALMPNAMYHNVAGQRFADVTASGGFGHLQKGHGIAFADFDSDGDLDVFEQMGGFFKGDRFYDVLYENPGLGNHWIGLKLIGTRSNRSAIGARIQVTLLDSEAGEKSIYRWVTSGGTFGASPLQQLIGVGQVNQIKKIEVYWPVTGKSQLLYDVTADQWLVVTEG